MLHVITKNARINALETLQKEGRIPYEPQPEVVEKVNAATDIAAILDILPNASVEAGDRIETRISAKGSTWYPGVVVGVHSVDGRLDLNYDDGDMESGALPENVRNFLIVATVPGTSTGSTYGGVCSASRPSPFSVASSRSPCWRVRRSRSTAFARSIFCLARVKAIRFRSSSRLSCAAASLSLLASSSCSPTNDMCSSFNRCLSAAVFMKFARCCAFCSFSRA